MGTFSNTFLGLTIWFDFWFLIIFLKIGINVGADQSGTLGGIEPKIRWSNSGEILGLDVAVRTNQRNIGIILDLTTRYN